MKSRTFTGAVFAALLFLALAASGAKAQNRLTVLTWNVQGNDQEAARQVSPGQSGCIPRSMADVERQLRTTRENYRRFGITIDVVAFQEVYREQADRLALMMGIPKEKVFFTPTKINCRNNKEFGDAIATNLNISSVRRHPLVYDEVWRLEGGRLLSAPFNHELTKLTALSVTLGSGRMVRVYTTHLAGDNSPTDSLLRNFGLPPYFGPREISSVYNTIYYTDGQRTRAYPFVLMGDFNFHRNYPVRYANYNPVLYNKFANTFRDLWVEWQFVNGNPESLYGLTWNYPTQTKRLDYIAAGKPNHLAAGVPQIRVFSASVPPALNAQGEPVKLGETPVRESDHRPVVAILDF